MLALTTSLRPPPSGRLLRCMYALRASSNPNALCMPRRPSCASPPPALTFVSISRSQAADAAAVGVGAPAVLGPMAPPQVRFPIVPTRTETQFAVSTLAASVLRLSVSGLEFRFDFALAPRLLLVLLVATPSRPLLFRRSPRRRHAF